MNKSIDISTIKTVYFIGIGGIGMSALARYFHSIGCVVSGYDRTPTLLTFELEAEGILVHFDEIGTYISKATDLVIYTPAVPMSHPAYAAAERQNLPLLKRAEILGILSENYRTLAFAGTHGKTTTSTMAAHIMHHGKMGCSAFLGGISKNYQSNLLIHPTSKWLVTEADEYDRSFLQLSPEIAIITSIDADHLDIYGDYHSLCLAFTQFASKIKERGTLIVKKPVLRKIKKQDHYQIFTYGIRDESLDFRAINIRYQNANACFDLEYPGGIISDIHPGIPGKVNIENAVAAAAGALIAGFSEQEIKTGIESFKGIRRRFDLQYESEDVVYIDDYAHHPEEIKALVESVREIYPHKKITGLFQPHLFTRTRDLVDEFAMSLSMLDEVLLMPIYAARELPIKGVSSEIILERIINKPARIIKINELENFLTTDFSGVFLSIGAGDIDKLTHKITEILSKNPSEKK
ncbi:MAG: UDP-N-acetylmuramate--L-alanine ligase [Bacteroidales bacterium]|nr:UDP-N-acetylmuramate--L-alanine ligase [Bacteroidales bacterium]